MGQKTKIEWSSHTFNPWYGCQKVSPACVHCYAETMSNRQLLKKKYGVQHLWGPKAKRRIAENEKWDEPLYWNRVAEKRNTRAQVFCGSMWDVMEDRRDLDGREWNELPTPNSSYLEKRDQLLYFCGIEL